MGSVLLHLVLARAAMGCLGVDPGYLWSKDALAWELEKMIEAGNGKEDAAVLWRLVVYTPPLINKQINKIMKFGGLLCHGYCQLFEDLVTYLVMKCWSGPCPWNFLSSRSRAKKMRFRSCLIQRSWATRTSHWPKLHNIDSFERIVLKCINQYSWCDVFFVKMMWTNLHNKRGVDWLSWGPRFLIFRPGNSLDSMDLRTAGCIELGELQCALKKSLGHSMLHAHGAIKMQQTWTKTRIWMTKCCWRCDKESLRESIWKHLLWT